MRVRTLGLASSFLFVASLVTASFWMASPASAQTQPSGPIGPQSGPTPQQVLDSPRAHVNADVQWVVTYRCILVDIGKDGRATPAAIMYDWHDPSGASVAVLGPTLDQTRWLGDDTGARQSILQIEPRLLTGRVRGVQAEVGPDGKAVLTVAVDDVAIAPMPLSPKNRIGPGYGSGSFTPGQGVSTPTMGVAYRPGPGVTYPAVLKEVKPAYPADAVASKIEGSVELELVVLPDGTVSDVRITKSLDSGGQFDKAAVAAAKQWQFKPGAKEGTPVPTRVSLVLDFRIKK